MNVILSMYAIIPHCLWYDSIVTQVKLQIGNSLLQSIIRQLELVKLLHTDFSLSLHSLYIIAGKRGK